MKSDRSSRGSGWHRRRSRESGTVSSREGDKHLFRGNQLHCGLQDGLNYRQSCGKGVRPLQAVQGVDPAKQVIGGGLVEVPAAAVGWPVRYGKFFVAELLSNFVDGRQERA